MKQEGYAQKQFGIKTKRFCQTLDLKDEPELIAAYKQLHDEDHVWREILDGIKEVGILEMEIYLLENRLFMIVETPEDFNWNDSMEKLAKLPKQEEWEALTGRYQKTKSGATSSEKWQLMDRIFPRFTFKTERHVTQHQTTAEKRLENFQGFANRML